MGFQFFCPLFSLAHQLIFCSQIQALKTKTKKITTMKLIRRSNFPTLINEIFRDDFFNVDFPKHESVPAVNVKENDANYELEVAIPGYNKEDINIEVKDNTLTISSTHKETTEDSEKGKYTRKEFSFRSFFRKFHLPKTVDKDAIKADYKNGILEVNIPKAEKVDDTKRIEIG